jgi:hypothetical protein
MDSRIHVHSEFLPECTHLYMYMYMYVLGYTVGNFLSDTVGIYIGITSVNTALSRNTTRYQTYHSRLHATGMGGVHVVLLSVLRCVRAWSAGRHRTAAASTVTVRRRYNVAVELSHP